MTINQEIVERTGEQLKLTEYLQQLDNAGTSTSDHVKRMLRAQRESMAKTANALTIRINNLTTLAQKIEKINQQAEQRKQQLMQA